MSDDSHALSRTRWTRDRRGQGLASIDRRWKHWTPARESQVPSIDDGSFEQVLSVSANRSGNGSERKTKTERQRKVRKLPIGRAIRPQRPVIRPGGANTARHAFASELLHVSWAGRLCRARSLQS